MWELFNTCAFQSKDKDGFERYRFSPEGLIFAFDVFFDPEKLALFRELRFLTSVMNRES
jgi:hypothetical protein